VRKARKHSTSWRLWIWRLVLAPPEVLDYLVVHELAHLLVQAHTAGFWLIVRSFCPRFESHRQWLKEHAVELRAIGVSV
jgi:predicted metal-dependent hydrolase